MGGNVLRQGRRRYFPVLAGERCAFAEFSRFWREILLTNPENVIGWASNRIAGVEKDEYPPETAKRAAVWCKADGDAGRKSPWSLLLKDDASKRGRVTGVIPSVREGGL